MSSVDLGHCNHRFNLGVYGWSVELRCPAKARTIYSSPFSPLLCSSASQCGSQELGYLVIAEVMLDIP